MKIVEEAGVRAAKLHPLGWIFTTPGFTDEKIHLFAATDLTPAAQSLDDDEVIDVVKMPLSEALRLAATGGIPDAKSLCALYRLAQELEAGRLQADRGGFRSRASARLRASPSRAQI